MLDIRYLSLDEIREMLELKDKRAVKKWLSDNGIPLSQIGKKHLVEEFPFEFKRQQISVENLRTSYPNNWFEIYDANTPDKGMVKAISALYPRKKALKKRRNKPTNLIK